MQRIRALRERLGLTQQQFAELFAVSSATVKLWEKGGLTPAQRDWQRIVLVEGEGVQAFALGGNGYTRTLLRERGAGYDMAGLSAAEPVAPSLDFTANPDIVRVVVEGSGSPMDISTIPPLPPKFP